MPTWDELYEKEGDIFKEPHQDMDRITQLFREFEVRRILDIGCGSGRHLVHFAKLGFEMYGFDCATAAIELASSKLAAENLNADVRFHRMEKPFPYDDGYFDAVISTQVIHHNLRRDIAVTVQEIDRVVKSGGLIFITVSMFKEDDTRDDWQLEEVEEGTYLPHAGKEKGILHHFFTEEELVNAFPNFKVIDLYVDYTRHRAIIAVKN